ncbi:MAG: hypothetical protein ACYS91_10615 [Planctomycetota bacterium]|jgi:hypothetical protein
MTKKIKIALGISAASLVVLILAAISIFFLGRYLLRQAFWMEPYDESHPESILVTIEDNSVVKFPENIESFKAADRTDRGIDSADYIFILSFKTDREGLAQLRESLSQLYKYKEWKVDLDQNAELLTFRLKDRPAKVRTPEWYRELPEGVVWTASGVGVDYYGEGGEGRKGKFHRISCTWVVLAESEEVEVYMEGDGYYSLKDYGD